VQGLLKNLQVNLSVATGISKHPITISIGSTFTRFEEGLDVVLKRADEALSVAKQNGGNGLIWF